VNNKIKNLFLSNSEGEESALLLKDFKDLLLGEDAPDTKEELLLEKQRLESEISTIQIKLMIGDFSVEIDTIQKNAVKFWKDFGAIKDYKFKVLPENHTLSLERNGRTLNIYVLEVGGAVVLVGELEGHDTIESMLSDAKVIIREFYVEAKARRVGQLTEIKRKLENLR
jgi:hypothetical protein